MTGESRPEQHAASSSAAPGNRTVPKIRDASVLDAEPCAEIYRPYVTDTVISFETEPPTAEDMAERIATALDKHAWLVLEDGGEVIGYAYGGPYKPRAAYWWSCEVSVYLAPGRRRTGGGRALYQALFERLAERDFRNALACITLPNEASIGLHRAVGFEPAGVFRRVGWKHGAWHDVAWLQRTLGEHEGPPQSL